ncbi:MAG: CBS domain-containing protein [Azoarcus sp.]|nr:CBS domain-containing protein [Azoarcus sp.]
MLKSLLVKDYMSGDPLAFKPDTEILDAIHLLLKHEMTGAPVIDNMGRVVGFLSEKDCIKTSLNASYHEERGGRVSELMSPNVITLEPDSSLMEAAEMFVGSAIRCYPVVENGRLVGQLSRRDVLRALEKLW